MTFLITQEAQLLSHRVGVSWGISFTTVPGVYPRSTAANPASDAGHCLARYNGRQFWIYLSFSRTAQVGTCIPMPATDSTLFIDLLDQFVDLVAVLIEVFVEEDLLLRVDPVAPSDE